MMLINKCIYSVKCPICQELYPPDEIEHHSGACDFSLVCFNTAICFLLTTNIFGDVKIYKLINMSPLHYQRPQVCVSVFAP